MTVYIVQVFLIGILGFFMNPNRSELRKRNYLFIVFLVLVIVSGLREYTVGADTKNYVAMFNSVNSVGAISARIEGGFVYYLKFLRLLSDDPRVLLFASASICVGVACVFIYKLSKAPIMSAELYVLMGGYFTQMNAMRQSIALAITEIAFLIILLNKDNLLWKKVLSGLFIVLAASFHTVAIIAFIPYALMLRNNGEDKETRLTAGKTLRNSFMAAIVGFVAYSIVMMAATRILPGYAYYFGNSSWSDANYNASLFNSLIAIIFAITGAWAFGRKKLNGVQRFAAIMIGFSIIFYVLSMRMEIWARVAGMFSAYTYFLWVPEFFSEMRNYHNRAIIKGTILAFAFAYMIVVLVFRPEWTQVVPYLLRQ